MAHLVRLGQGHRGRAMTPATWYSLPVGAIQVLRPADAEPVGRGRRVEPPVPQVPTWPQVTLVTGVVTRVPGILLFWRGFW